MSDLDHIRAMPSARAATASQPSPQAVSGIAGIAIATRVLTIPVNGVYFDQIAAGVKPEEYRLANEYWAKRLLRRAYDRVVLTRGYPKAGGVEGVTRLTREYRGFELRTITHPHFGADPVEVFAIDVSQPA